MSLCWGFVGKRSKAHSINRASDRHSERLIVNVQSATHSNQLDEPRGFVVVADIEGERQALLAWLRFADGTSMRMGMIERRTGRAASWGMGICDCSNLEKTIPTNENLHRSNRRWRSYDAVPILYCPGKTR